MLICILYQWDLLIDGSNVRISPGLFVFSFLWGWRVEIGSLYTGLNNETLSQGKKKEGVFIICVYVMCMSVCHGPACGGQRQLCWFQGLNSACNDCGTSSLPAEPSRQPIFPTFVTVLFSFVHQENLQRFFSFACLCL